MIMKASQTHLDILEKISSARFVQLFEIPALFNPAGHVFQTPAKIMHLRVNIFPSKEFSTNPWVYWFRPLCSQVMIDHGWFFLAVEKYDDELFGVEWVMNRDGSVKLVLAHQQYWIYVRYDTGVISFVHRMENSQPGNSKIFKLLLHATKVGKNRVFPPILKNL